MKRAFIYKDEKSHKFWWIDYSGCDFAVNYGKFDSIGKFEIKDFDTEEECLKQAEKLIHSKKKKRICRRRQLRLHAQILY